MLNLRRFAVALLLFVCASLSFAQPADLARYSVSQLEVFPHYTRASYEAATGHQAPAFDPKQEVKDWADPAAATLPPAQMVRYLVLDKNEKGQYVQVPYEMTAARAASVNLMGLVNYPAYKVAPTAAYKISPHNGTKTPISANNLSTREQAIALDKELNGPGANTVQQEDYESGFFTMIWGAEDRRPYLVQYKGGDYFKVGVILAQKYATGIGAPGHWDPTTASPLWWPDFQPSGLNGPTVPKMAPTPLRALTPNEQLVSGAIGIPEVIRTDLLPAAEPTFTREDREMLQEVYRLFKRIAAIFPEGVFTPNPYTAVGIN